jgi:hypothetical protein
MRKNQRLQPEDLRNKKRVLSQFNRSAATAAAIGRLEASVTSQIRTASKNKRSILRQLGISNWYFRCRPGAQEKVPGIRFQGPGFGRGGSRSAIVAYGDPFLAGRCGRIWA